MKLVYHSTLGWKQIEKEKKRVCRGATLLGVKRSRV